MATNARNDSGRDYQTWKEAAQEQDQRERDKQDTNRNENRVQEYLKRHPSVSWAEANYKTRN